MSATSDALATQRSTTVLAASAVSVLAAAGIAVGAWFVSASPTEYTVYSYTPAARQSWTDLGQAVCESTASPHAVSGATALTCDGVPASDDRGETLVCYPVPGSDTEAMCGRAYGPRAISPTMLPH